MIGKRFERTVYMRTARRSDENQIGMTGGEIDTGGENPSLSPAGGGRRRASA